MQQKLFIFPSSKPIYKIISITEFKKINFYAFGLYNISFANIHKQLWTVG